MRDPKGKGTKNDHNDDEDDPDTNTNTDSTFKNNNATIETIGAHIDNNETNNDSNSKANEQQGDNGTAGLHTLDDE